MKLYLCYCLYHKFHNNCLAWGVSNDLHFCVEISVDFGRCSTLLSSGFTLISDDDNVLHLPKSTEISTQKCKSFETPQARQLL